jgi:acetyltransferase-like isoleucine patch superfamily enzyme
LYADPRDGGGTITIEDNVLIGAGVHLYTNNHEFRNPNIPIINQGYPRASLSDSIILRKGSWIGAGVIIMPGIEIGENAVVGAGSIVTKSLSPRNVYAGNPAIMINRIE